MRNLLNGTTTSLNLGGDSIMVMKLIAIGASKGTILTAQDVFFRRSSVVQDGTGIQTGNGLHNAGQTGVSTILAS
jgi:hypothetical protein